MEMITNARRLTNGKLELLIRNCPVCDEPHKLIVDYYAFEDWADGIKNLQDAFPDMPPAEQELLLTGMDGECFANMPKEEDYESGEENEQE